MAAQNVSRIKTLITRSLTKQVIEDLKDIEAVFINGPRQAGKSTFVETIAENQTIQWAKHFKNVISISFDDITVRSAEIHSPGSSFSDFSDGLVILDEIQLVPDSFLALKAKIDDIRRKKQNVKFLLTGSADIMVFPKLSQALVGRMYVRTMYPFSAAEIIGSAAGENPDGYFIEKMFKEIPNIIKKYPKFNFSSVVSKATYPKLSLEIKNKIQWCQSYISTILERDVKNLSDIDKIEILPQLLSVMAIRAGGLLNEANLASAIKISQPTLKRYRALLDGIFLTFLLPPWFKNMEKRFVKSPKIYFYDTMLLCHLLGGLPEEIKNRNPASYGFLLENFVVTELKKQLGDDATIYHLRTSDLKEIDFIIERRDGSIMAVEVKASKTVNADDFKHIRFFQNAHQNKKIPGIVLYTGETIVKFGGNLYAVPISALWEK